MWHACCCQYDAQCVLTYFCMGVQNGPHYRGRNITNLWNKRHLCSTNGSHVWWSSVLHHIKAITSHLPTSTNTCQACACWIETSCFVWCSFITHTTQMPRSPRKRPSIRATCLRKEGIPVASHSEVYDLHRNLLTLFHRYKSNKLWRKVIGLPPLKMLQAGVQAHKALNSGRQMQRELWSKVQTQTNIHSPSRQHLLFMSNSRAEIGNPGRALLWVQAKPALSWCLFSFSHLVFK
jgi:hypothetical protein